MLVFHNNFLFAAAVLVFLPFQISCARPLNSNCSSSGLLNNGVCIATGKTDFQLKASSCSQTPGIFTQYVPSPGTIVIYVSNSLGNNSYDGLYPDNSLGGNRGPKKSISAGVSMLRNGQPDWLLLRRGDVWQESFGNWSKSGLSNTQRMVVSTYGSATQRPLLQTGNTVDGLEFCCSSSGPKNLVFDGFELYPNTYNGAAGGPVGIRLLGLSQNILFEDIRVSRYATGIIFQPYDGTQNLPRHTNIALRNSKISDAYSVAGHSQGGYFYGVDGLLIEGNVIFHNGWSNTAGGADMFRHNVYVDNGNTLVKFCDNISADASSHGAQLRSGGDAIDNLFVRNPIATVMGGGNQPNPGGVLANFKHNVIMDGRDIDATNFRGWAAVFANISSGVVENTLITRNSLGHNPSGIVIDGDHMGDPGSTNNGVHNLRFIRNLLYNWAGESQIQGTPAQVSGITFEQNEFSNSETADALINVANAPLLSAITSSFHNRFESIAPASSWFFVAGSPQNLLQWMSLTGDTTSTTFTSSYPDPNRSLATYDLLTGGTGTYDNFIVRALAASRINFDPDLTAPKVNDYFRAGFGR